MDRTTSTNSNNNNRSPEKKTTTTVAVQLAPLPPRAGTKCSPSSSRDCRQSPPPVPLAAPVPVPVQALQSSSSPSRAGGGASPMRGPMAPNANPIMQPAKTTTALINHNTNNAGQRAAIKLAARPSAKQPSIHQKQSWQQHQSTTTTPRHRQVRQQPEFFQPPDSPSVSVGGGQHCSTVMECSLATTNTSATNSGAPRSANDLGLIGSDDLSDCSCNSLDCLTDLSQSATSSQMDPLDGPLNANSVPGDLMVQHGRHSHPSPPSAVHQHGQQHHSHQHPHDQHQHHHHHPHHQLAPHHHRHHHHHHHDHHPHASHQPTHHHHHVHHNQQMHQQQQPQQAQYHHPSMSAATKPNHSNQPSLQQQHRPLIPYASLPPLAAGVVSGPQGGSPPQAAGSQQPPPLVRHSTYTAGSDTITDATALHHHHHGYHKSLSPGPPPPPPPSVMGERPPNRQATSDFIHPTNHQQQSPYERPPPPPPLQNNPDNNVMSPCKQNYRSLKPVVSFRRSATTREPANNRWRGQQQQQQEHQLLFDYNQEHHQLIDQSSSSLERAGHRNGTNSLQRQRSAAPNGGQPHNTGQRSHSSTTPRLVHDNNRSSTWIDNSCPLQLMSPFSASTAATTVSTAATGGGRNSMPHNRDPPTGLYYPSSPIQPSLTTHQHPHPNPPPPAPPPPPPPPLLSSSSLNANNRASHMMATSPFEGAAFCPLPAVTSHRTNSPWMRISSIIATPIGIVIILFIVISPLLHYLM